MIYDLLIPLVSVALAEIGDKTQLTLLCLAAKTKRHFSIFLGAMIAFIIVDGIAILAGGFISNLIPVSIIKTISAILFIGFGLSFLLQKLEDHTSCTLKQPFVSAFSMILFSEMGDKTQIASAVFASNYNALYVFFGVVIGLSIVSIITIQLGQRVLSKINSKLLHKISGIIFIALGIISILSIFI